MQRSQTEHSVKSFNSSEPSEANEINDTFMHGSALDNLRSRPFATVVFLIIPAIFCYRWFVNGNVSDPISLIIFFVWGLTFYWLFYVKVVDEENVDSKANNDGN